MFNWIRARVRDAFLAGIQDGVDALSLPATTTAQVDALPEPRVLRLPPADADSDGDDGGPVVTVQSVRRGKK